MASPIYTLVDTDVTQQTNFFDPSEFIIRTWEVPDMDSAALAEFPNLEFRIHFIVSTSSSPSPARVKFRLNGTRYGVDGTVLFDEDIEPDPNGVFTHHASSPIIVANPNQAINLIKLGMICELDNIIDSITVLIRGVE